MPNGGRGRALARLLNACWDLPAGRDELCVRRVSRRCLDVVSVGEWGPGTMGVGGSRWREDGYGKCLEAYKRL
jgi:hypothetical protein